MIADNHAVVREGLKALLDNEADIKITAEASEGKEMTKKVKDLGPDILIVDVSMPNLAGVEFIKELSKTTKVIILTMYQQQEYIREALHAGAMGYLLKTSSSEEVMNAIRSAYRGKYFLSAEINADIINNYLKKETDQPYLSSYEQLTRREQQIFKMMAEGSTANEIGGRLGISPKTVAKHRTNLMEKLNMKNTAGLVRYALRLGIVDMEKVSG